MRRLILTLITFIGVMAASAQTYQQVYKAMRQQAMHQQPFTPAVGLTQRAGAPTAENAQQPGAPITGIASRMDKVDSQQMNLQTRNVRGVRKVEEADEEFIFDPAGREQIYCMSLYSYDTSNSKFVRAQSLLSQVRTAADGKTVYFKNLTESLGTITWLKGEKKVMEKDSLEVGIKKGDVVIQVPFGQPLVYYQAKYLVFFVPMMFNDATGNFEAQDNYTLIQRGDSLVQPTYSEGNFQAAAGYVMISETKQGSLSIDIDHSMRLETKKITEAPASVAPTEYVHTFINSYGNVYKKKVSVKRQGDDLYMQLSTSSPKSYVKGTLSNGQITLGQPQLITDSTFLYYYSLGDPVYEEGELTDFVPTSAARLQYDETTLAVSPLPAKAGDPVFAADYLDGMELVKDYIQDPVLTLYPGDKPATPINPTIRSINLDGGFVGSMTFNNMYFVTPALDVDSNYINVDHLYYRLYINGELYPLSPEVYKNLAEPMIDIPYAFADGYDIYSYDLLHCIYLYKEKQDVQSIGVQSVYKVDGKDWLSEIVTERFDTPVPDDTRKDNDIALTSIHLKDNMLKAGAQGSVRGVITNTGKNNITGYTVTLSTGGKTSTRTVNEAILAGNTAAFELPFTAANDVEGKAYSVEVEVKLADDVQDATPADNTATLTYGIYTQSFTQPTLLLEEFTSESCGWCPYGAYRVHTAIEEADLQNDVVWVCHHEGYGVDWLTVDASTAYTALYGGNTFAPAMMINRDQKFSDEPFPVYSIGQIDEIKPQLTEALQAPCFVKLKADNQYSDGNLHITVKVEKSPLFDIQCPQPRLTVFIVEDSIKSKKQKTYDSHTIAYHHNALREVASDVWGDKMVWNGNTSEQTYIIPVSADYTVQNLRIVAFVHDSGTDINQRRIFNTTLSATDPATGVEAVESAATSTASPLLYNLHGQRVARGYRGIVVKEGRKLVR